MVTAERPVQIWPKLTVFPDSAEGPRMQMLSPTLHVGHTARQCLEA
jgi:hypothetical protein